MRVLIQRVSEAAVTIGGEEFSRIGAGLLLFVGVEEADTDEDIEWLAGKIARLRVFDDEAGVMNLALSQLHRSHGSGESGTFALRTGAAGPRTPQLRAPHSPEPEGEGGEVLVISQFTLHASIRKGNRPSYIRAARPEIAEPLYEKFVARLSHELGGCRVRTGVFGADMKVSLTNDGPVTIMADSKNRE